MRAVCSFYFVVVAVGVIVGVVGVVAAWLHAYDTPQYGLSVLSFCIFSILYLLIFFFWFCCSFRELLSI